MTEDLSSLVERLRMSGGDSTSVEVKSASGGLPQSIGSSLCALANLPGGGTIILGLDERKGFQPVPLTDPQGLKQGLAAKARALIPPVRLNVEDGTVDGSPVVIAQVHECNPSLKPCRTTSGKAYLRSYDGDSELSDLEKQAFLAARTSPMAERKPVEGATLEDLDPDLLARFVESIRRRDPEGRGRFSDQRELLRRSGVLHPAGSPTVAGILALGLYPQEWFPRLVIQAAAEPLRGEPPTARARNPATIDGPIPQMLDKAMAWARQTFDTYIVNAPDGSVHDQYAYPLDAFRELIANALIHRDLDQWSAGLATEVRLRRDRLVITNPGGLYGITVDRLGKDTVTSARNDRLAAICQHVYSAETGARAIEALASGIPIVTRAVADAGLPPARYNDSGIRFTVILRQRTPEPAHEQAPTPPHRQAPESAALSPVDRLVLASLDAGPRSVAQLEEATGTPAYTIRRVLRALREGGLVSQHGGKGRRTTYSRTPYSRTQEPPSGTGASQQVTEAPPLAVPSSKPDYEPAADSPPREPRRRPNSVTVLIDSGAIDDGTPLTFRPKGREERQVVEPWLAGDPRRAQATWVSQRSRPLIWAADQEAYSPSGLVTRIWDLSGWPEPPIAVQGPTRWYLPDGRSLWDAALDILDEDDS